MVMGAVDDTFGINEYTVNGRIVPKPGICGIYNAVHGLGAEYFPIEPDELVTRINKIPIEDALKALTIIRDVAAEQVKWHNTPQGPLYPILVQSPPPIPIGMARPYLKNTMAFCDELLTALKGE